MHIHTLAILATLTLAGAAGSNARAAESGPPIDTLTASEAARQICGGRLSSEALARAYLTRIRARPELNAFITVNEDGAMDAARKADAEQKSLRGKPCRPLLGVPIVVKDNIHVAGLPSTAGTPGLKGFVPAQSAPVAQKLIDAGAIVLGKTNMHELAFGISGYNPSFKTGPQPGVRNAYDATRMAGGSSSGTAAALGARMAAAGLGTDTGGSVRIPCALNGCASLRPTLGRYSQEAIAPISHTRDTAGPMAHSMQDVALLDRVIAGGTTLAPAPLRGLRLGIVKDFYANLDADTQAAMDSALAIMKRAGVVLVNVEMPRLAELNGAVGFPLALYEAFDDMNAYLQRYDTGKTIETLAEEIASPDVKGTYQGLVIPRKLPGPDNTVVDAKPAYDAAISTARPALIALYKDTFATHRLDALVFPTVPKIAALANADASSVPTFMAFIQNTDPGSNAGLPGIQLPIGFGASSKLPIGMELDGPAGSDRKLLAIGMALENKLFKRLPAPK